MGQNPSQTAEIVRQMFYSGGKSARTKCPWISRNFQEELTTQRNERGRKGEGCTHTVTGNTLLAAVTVMQELNTTCSQWPCRTQSSEFQAAGRVKVMLISSWDSLPLGKTQGKLRVWVTKVSE